MDSSVATRDGCSSGEEALSSHEPGGGARVLSAMLAEAILGMSIEAQRSKGTELGRSQLTQHSQACARDEGPPATSGGYATLKLILWNKRFRLDPSLVGAAEHQKRAG